LLIFRERILDSRVEGGMPSLAAAPCWPDTLPFVCLSPASFCFCCIEFALTTAGDEDVCALRNEALSRGETDSTIACRDNCNFSLQLTHQVLLFDSPSTCDGQAALCNSTARLRGVSTSVRPIRRRSSARTRSETALTTSAPSCV